MSHVPPQNVISPKARLQLVKVLIDRGAGDAAYALARWDEKPCIVFRWNGSDAEGDRLGNPQSRGLPTWVVLDSQLVDPVIDGLLKGQHDLQAFARMFLKP